MIQRMRKKVQTANAQDLLHNAIADISLDDGGQSLTEQYTALDGLLKSHQTGREQYMLAPLRSINNPLATAIKQRIDSQTLALKDIPAVLRRRKSQLEPLVKINNLWYDFNNRQVKADENLKKIQQDVADQIGENIHSMKRRFNLHPFSTAIDKGTNEILNHKLVDITNRIETYYLRWCARNELATKETDATKVETVAESKRNPSIPATPPAPLVIDTRAMGQSGTQGSQQLSQPAPEWRGMAYTGTAIGLVVGVLLTLAAWFICPPLGLAITLKELLIGGTIASIITANIGGLIQNYHQGDLSSATNPNVYRNSVVDPSHRPSSSPRLRAMAAKSAKNGGHHQVEEQKDSKKSAAPVAATSGTMLDRASEFAVTSRKLKI